MQRNLTASVIVLSRYLFFADGFRRAEDEIRHHADVAMNRLYFEVLSFFNIIESMK